MRLLIPSASGQYPVGMSYWTIQIPQRVFGSAKYNKTVPVAEQRGQHAFVLEEVAFHVFYPADTTKPGSKSSFGYQWMDRPLTEQMLGYSDYLGISHFASWSGVLWTWNMWIPAYAEAPLLEPPPEISGGKWPVVFFSHGLCGTSKMYTQLCCKLASEGYIVVSLEHRDGTGPTVTLPIEGERQHRRYLRTRHLDWDEKLKEPTTPRPLRTQQLDIRSVELFETFKGLKAVVTGSSEKSSIMTSTAQYSAWDSWRNRVDVDSIIFAGHSFGACTALHLLTTPTPPEYEPLPISKVIMHDIWMDPIAPETAREALKVPTLRTSIPILLINSEQYTLWSSHQTLVKDLFLPWIQRAEGGSSFVTITKTEHMSSTDRDIFIPWNHVAAKRLHKDIHQLCMAFLRDGTGSQGVAELLAANAHRVIDEENMVVQNPGNRKRQKIRAAARSLVVHSPPLESPSRGEADSEKSTYGL